MHVCKQEYDGIPTRCRGSLLAAFQSKTKDYTKRACRPSCAPLHCSSYQSHWRHCCWVMLPAPPCPAAGAVACHKVLQHAQGPEPCRPCCGCCIPVLPVCHSNACTATCRSALIQYPCTSHPFIQMRTVHALWRLWGPKNIL